MSEYQVETRGRSRSKTPFLRSSCDHEHCEYAGEEGHQHHHHPKKKAAAAPTVNTIIEETPKEKVQYRATTTTTTTTTSTRSKTGSEEDKLNHSNQSAKVSSETTTVVTKNTKKIGSGSGSTGPASSTPKNQMLQSFAAQFSTTGSGSGGGGSVGNRRVKEITQNEINTRFEQSQQKQHNNKSSNMSWQSKSDSSSLINGDLNDHIAYKEYKSAGEYWNKTPKTDYTYSRFSTDRRELAPGVVAMPNMSRTGLRNHDSRVYHMIERNPAQEEFIRKRYFSQEQNKNIENRRATERLLYDSNDELDYTEFERFGAERQAQLLKNRYSQHLQKQESSWFMRLLTTIVTSITSVWCVISGGDIDEQNYQLYRGGQYYASMERGFFGTIWHSLLSSLRYVYLAISSVLSLDTWLLQSSNANNRGKKRFLLLLLILLPLLLLAAWQLLDDAQRQYYLQRTEDLLPLSILASLKSSFLSSGAALQGLWYQVPLLIKNYAFNKDSNSKATADQIHLHNMQLNLQRTGGLTPEEYENILNHINSYVQQLVDVKMLQQQQHQEQQATQNQQISPEQTEIFVKIVRENLENLSREKRESANEAAASFDVNTLSDDDLSILAQRIEIHLANNENWTQRPVKLSAENIAEIKKLIITHHEHHYTLLVERIDLDALLARLLKAPQLAKFVDARIEAAILDGQLKIKTESSGAGAHISMSKTNEAAIDAQQTLLNELNSEIAFIKLTLADKNAENEDLQQSIARLKLGQDDLLERLQRHEFATDERFSGLWAEIQEKIGALHEKQFNLLNKQIKLTLIEILGFKQTVAGEKFEDIDLQNWVRNIFVAKDYLEERLMEMNEKTNERIKDEIDRSGVLLMRDISERLKNEILISVEAKHLENTKTLKTEIHHALSEEEVRKIVKSVLAIYDADKTGLVDFALESAGGQILSTRCTEIYHTKSALVSVFGIPLWYPSNTPRVAISPNVQPGECWAFQGFPGYLVLKLNSLVYVTGFTLEHIPRSLSPTGRIDSAPKNFTVWGLEHEKDQEPVLFGEYEYSDNDASLQYFAVQNQNIKRPYEIVEVRIETNHGHRQYTCLYRFRVHGKPPAM